MDGLSPINQAVMNGTRWRRTHTSFTPGCTLRSSVLNTTASETTNIIAYIAATKQFNVVQKSRDPGYPLPTYAILGKTSKILGKIANRILKL